MCISVQLQTYKHMVYNDLPVTYGSVVLDIVKCIIEKISWKKIPLHEKTCCIMCQLKSKYTVLTHILFAAKYMSLVSVHQNIMTCMMLRMFAANI